jgi:hypothetical protein
MDSLLVVFAFIFEKKSKERDHFGKNGRSGVMCITGRFLRKNDKDEYFITW